VLLSIWITGLTRSGKTRRLVELFREWVQEKRQQCHTLTQIASQVQPLTSAVLVFAANDDNRSSLAEQLSTTLPGSYPVLCKTPLGFISNEVMLFFPLLFEQLNIKAQFPLRLRPETEQELATRLWKPQLSHQNFLKSDTSEFRFVRDTLDLLQLAGAGGIPTEDIATILEQGLGDLESFPGDSPQFRGQLLLQWRQWCLERGLLTYGIIYELYWRYLLPNPKYQSYLIQRYQGIFADDVDDYPAIAADLFTLLLDKGIFGVFTANPDGQIRLGLNADPEALTELEKLCQTEELTASGGLAAELGESTLKIVTDPFYVSSLPASIPSIQTTTRAELLRKTGEVIIQAIQQNKVKPDEIAIIAPGLDEIARYTLIEILSHQNIPVEPLNEQRPLISSPLIRALLTLLGLVYPGLGRLVKRDEVGEMLVILSRKRRKSAEKVPQKLIADIDPVRAGLIADYCYHIDLENPRLLGVETFPRWDRLGHRATQAYREIRDWIETSKSLLKQQRFATPMVVLDRAIKSFILGKHAYAEMAALRELIETAQHFWEVERRLRQNEPNPRSLTDTVGQLIQLLRRGTITANALPGRILEEKQGVVILATIFQYRSLRSSHRWQFWLDAGSHLWEKGGASQLYGAPLFLRNWNGQVITPEDEFKADQARLERILRDLLGRVTERVYLCHSELGVTGSEQAGALISLVQSSQYYE
jgi:hypothetical protein